MITPNQSAPKLAKKLGLNAELILKREDLHPYGSHKGRSMPFIIQEYIKKGIKNFVISSSGNAALAAAETVKDYNSEDPDKKISLKIFIGENIDSEKFKKIQNYSKFENIFIEQTKRPKQSAFLANKEKGLTLLRQSTDDLALKGYQELADELGEVSAVFIPTSSGTTAQGLYEGFKKNNLTPQIHIAQTTECHPFAESDKKIKAEKSLALAIVDTVGHRRQEIKNVLKNSRGRGYIITNKEIKKAMKLIKKTENLEISPNSALSIAALRQAIKDKTDLGKKVVCLITGK